MDVYVRIFAGTYEAKQEAHYHAYQPWDWYQFPVWEAMGQQPGNFEYIVEDSIDVARHQVLSTRGEYRTELTAA